MAIAEIFLAAFVQVLFEKLASGELLNFARREGIHSQLEKMKKMLLRIRAVLRDAEDKQITDEAVKMWLEDLQDLAYDLDDLLDEFATEALRRKLAADPQSATTSKVRSLIPSCCTSFTPTAFTFDHTMRSKIAEISSRLQEIATQRNDLDLKETSVTVSSSKIANERLPTTCLVDKSTVYGRHQDKEAILELLLRGETRGDGGVCFIPIVGMGGVGKTTLAQLVYDDDRVKSHFELKAWVCVSDVFDVMRVTKTILDSITSSVSNFEDLNSLQVQLKEALSGKKFLLVLDDVWSENYEKWDVLRRPFLVGAPGSKIILTTRHESVASVVRTAPSYALKELSNDDCLSVFAQHALGRRNFDAHPSLKEIGEKIVRKCKGLPLAAKALGGLLRNNLHQTEWEDILYSSMWELPPEKFEILPALRLSYHHLPSHLKRCFAYCSIFPKDYEFDKEELVLLWMGAGLLQSSKIKRMEDFGSKYFYDLLLRSFFQQSSRNETRFVMHDLVTDLAQFVAGEMCIMLVDKLENNGQHILSKRARHLSYTRQQYDVFQKFEALCTAQHLRTFLPLPIAVRDQSDEDEDQGQSSEAEEYRQYMKVEYYLSNRVLSDLLPKLHFLRVLSLSGYSISELPNWIGKLKHLRYLNLSGTMITCLPDSVGTLYNLQTLLLCSCHALCKLPSNTGNLINLRHLDNANTDQLQEMPLGIGKLINLQTLSKIVVGEGGGSRLTELKNLLLLRGTLSIVGLQNVGNVGGAKEANLKGKLGLDELGLKWSSDFDVSRNEKLETDVLDMLQPHRNLKKLKIEFYGGTKFPGWVGDPLFSKMVDLSLSDCRKCTSLPPLGQLPLLKKLCIRGIHGVKRVTEEFYRDGSSSQFPFPSLQRLTFEDMSAWEEWSCLDGIENAGGQFPCLQSLIIRNCPQLIRVPSLKLPSLHELHLQNCHEVVLTSVTGLTSLTTLKAENITGLSHVQEEFVRSLVALKVVEFRKCNQLVSLWQNFAALACLKELVVEECFELMSLGEELPSNLESLELVGCANMQKLPNGLSGVTALRKLNIQRCPKLGYAPAQKNKSMEDARKIVELSNCAQVVQEQDNNTSSLEWLSIHNWPNVGMFLGCLNYFANLRVLTIEGCEGVDSFPERGLSTPNLECLGIYNCKNLRYLWRDQIESLTSLQLLGIVGCSSLESLSEGGLPTPNLVNLNMSYCPNLRTVPFHHIGSLTALQSLTISNCPCLELFPKHNLPPNLAYISISADKEKLKPLPEWQLFKLTSLRTFLIWGGYPELISFWDEKSAASVFASTVTNLIIMDFPSLESVSSETLQNLTSLEHLLILNCPKLSSLPREGLPSTLGCLDINYCPLLKQRCLKEGGDYWPMIAHIPCVKIDGEICS